MIIELYNKMLFKYKLYPTYSICTIYNRIMDRKNHQKNLGATHQGKSSNANLHQKKATSLKNPSPISTSTLIATNISSTSGNNNINKNNNQNTPGSVKNLEISNTLISISELEKQQQFRARSIKSKFDESEISDKYVFLDVYPCVECQMPIDLYSICRNFKDMNKDLEWALCTNCQTKILPKLRIKYIEKKENFSNNKNDENQNTVFSVRRDSCSSLNSDHHNCDESEVLYSPFHLKYNFYNSSFIESRLKLDIDYFKIKFNAIFWNSIWYFKIKDLPYDFISPYDEPLAERVKLSTINNSSNANVYNVNSNNNMNELGINVSNNNKSRGMNRLDSIQNLITNRNLTAGNSSSSVSANKNVDINNNNLNSNTNIVNNTSSGADSKNLKFDEDDMDCIIINREKEINFEVNEKNYSVRDITSKIAHDDKGKGKSRFFINILQKPLIPNLRGLLILINNYLPSIAY